MSQGMKRLVVAVLFLLLGWLTIHVGLGPTRSAGDLTAQLQVRATRALDDAGYRWADVVMSGQKAQLEGVAPSAADRDNARRLIRRSTGPGGEIRGGVTKIKDTIEVLERRSPYELSAALEGDTLVLTGYAPSPQVREAIHAHASEQFSGVIRDEIKLAAGEPEDADWERAARFGFVQLVRLQRGDLTITDTVMRLEGEAAVPALADDVTQRFANPPEPFTARAAITTPSGNDAVAPQPTPPALDDEDDTPITVRDDCQDRFDMLLARNTIEFDSGSATIRNASFSLLDQLARTARRCATFSVRIEGHTDNTGDPSANLRLSRARANAVVGYLIAQGVASDRLRALGFGSDRPIASNATAEGRARNRRIEFNID